MQSYSVEYLRRILTRCEPIAFSEHALRALVPKGKRQTPKSDLLKLIEFVTKVPGEQMVRSDPTGLENFVELAVMQSNSLGRRSRELQLPPNYPRHGVYGMEIISGTRQELL